MLTTGWFLGAVATLLYILEVVLASSRRVKKGPGRRPQSAKRQRFMELRARWWSVRARPAKSGFRGPLGRTGHAVTRSTATAWSSGSSRRWIGWRSVRSAPDTCLRTNAKGSPILRLAGLSLRAIAQKLGRSPSTISRELRRNAGPGRGYRPFDAHRRATVRRARRHQRRVDTNDELGAWSASCSRSDGARNRSAVICSCVSPDDPSMRLCHESIYQAVYQPNSRFLRPSRLAPHRRSPLRTGRDHRRAHHRQQRRRGRFQQPMLTIHDRPFPLSAPVES